MPEKPLPLRKLKALMAIKGLSLEAVARKARVEYSTASQILNGHWNDALRLKKLSDAIEKAPGPTLTVHA